MVVKNNHCLMLGSAFACGGHLMPHKGFNWFLLL